MQLCILCRSNYQILALRLATIPIKWNIEIKNRENGGKEKKLIDKEREEDLKH